ncbi:MAG TPA: hypothetical protein PK096_00165 [Candidatus Saccharibacteria bacterium]|nr:hypothetical protein [Candidatus Saccharibacteria bacterium]HRK93769.1 hypothetical protein [Candidatus Saccharibacteria bacterium]
MSNGVKTIRRLTTVALAFMAVLGGLWVLLGQFSTPVNAVAGTNEQINFQGRLFNGQGAVVPDGFYNVEFKIYQDGTGTAVGNPSGTLEWTESHLNNDGNGIQVKNGYMSVELGSVNAFGSQVDWNQSVLWLSMNIGSTNGTCATFAACSPDGEMIPMKRLSSSVYSLQSSNSNKLGGLTSGQFVQMAQGVQTDASTASSIFINKTGGSGNLLQLQASGADVFNLTNSGDIQFGAGSNHALSIATSPASTVGRNLTMSAGTGGSGTGSAGGDLVLQGGNAGGTNGNGGNITIDAGAKTGAGTGGIINVGGANVSTVNIGNTGTTASVRVGNSTGAVAQSIDIGTNATASSSTTLSMGSAISTSSTAINAGTGGLTIGTANVANTLQIGSTTLNSGTQTINIGTNNTSGGTTNVTIGSGSSATGGTTNLQAKTSIALSTNGIARATLDNAGAIYFGNGVTAAAPSNFTISGTGSSTTAVAGGTVTVQGGNATVGNANGGNLTLSGGTGVGTGSNGLVVISTPTFSTTSNDPNCYTGGALVASSCTIAASSVNNSSAVLAGFNTSGQTATLPDPTITTAGRVVYVTAANGSSEFTLSVNGGGAGNQIAMRQNTTATMIWNGNDWTAAGASSSTTLQAAYDNTLTSAGGAELLLSNGSNANGLTIRDSSTNPVNGTLLEVQNSSAANLFSVNSNVTEYATNAGAETAGGTSTTFPSNTWSALTGGTVTRYITAGNNVATGQASVSTVTTGTANAGVKNQLSGTLSADTTYNVSFTTRLSTGTFTDMNVYYSVDGSAASVSCTTGATAATSVWTKVNCTFTTPSAGITSSNAIFIRQTAGTARTFYVDNLSVTIAADYNFATDGSVNDNTNFATNWSYSTGTGTGTVTRNTSDGYDASDSAQVAISSGAANAGVRNALSSTPLPSTLYRMTVYAKLSSGTFTDFKLRYSRDGGTNFVDCVDYNTQTLSTSAWTKVTCYIQTDATTATNPYAYFVETTSSARTFMVDAFSMTLRSATTPNVQIGGGVNGGPTTLLTLDKGASAPIASDNDALLGSMYYDTTLGKLQCYEADGWGACGSSPDNIVTISPEYTNAVMHGTGVGTMTSDLCSDTLNINDGSSSQPTICGSNETYNYYKWTSPQPTSQTYSIYVTYQLPSTFKEFSSGQTSLMGRTDSANSSVTYQIYRSDSSGLIACGAAISVSSGVQSTWQTGQATGSADPSTCGFGPGNSIVFKISMTSSSTANAYVGNLGFTFSNR